MIDNPNFSLDLGHPWQEVANDDPELYNFRDKARDITITLSAMTLDVDADTIDQVTHVLVNSRLRAEDEAARAVDHPTTIYEPIVVPRPWGRAVAYYGHDDSGRQFSYSGIVTRRSVINLYMSTTSLSETELLQVMDDVGSRIGFDHTPLPASSAGPSSSLR